MNSDTVEFYLYSTISLSCLYLIAITYYKYFVAKYWHKTFAEIQNINVLNEAKGHYLFGEKDKEVNSLNIQYTYSISGKTYKGSKASLIDDLPFFSNFEAENYAEFNELSVNEGKLPIYVNPKNNKSSLIIRELNTSKITNLLIISIVFFLLSLNKLNALDSFTLYSYLMLCVSLGPIVTIERLAFQKNMSHETNDK
ncbi:MAG: hypothetical protein DIZ80_16730 [endosymbiont of Galathealinum brachiosum]|uniref:DUF3592 domain-containing protein n=1 Tax=endosymbiont of Galathealinum brachiosum TaxID=2200906 RepID=A0A370D8H0_9GAMM|nr:MAG: hypothetical protein DIZ80_16730 [endosymbiont of Galathealinum brachiosum]